MNPELGDVGASGQASAQVQTTTTTRTVEPAPVVGTTTTTTESTAITTDVPNRWPDTDHGSVVGHFGVGFFGVLSVPVAGPGGMGDFDETVSAPTIGIRWWMQDWLGIEAALGLGIESSGSSVDDGDTEVTQDGPSVFALALHGGLPLVFAAGKHYAFEVVPELNFGFASGGVGDDVDVSGFLLALGARAGAEIQFGFIDIPQLALQASVGLRLRYESRSVTEGDTESSAHAFRFGTTVEGEPWDIFQGNLTAIYYF